MGTVGRGPLQPLPDRAWTGPPRESVPSLSVLLRRAVLSQSSVSARESQGEAAAPGDSLLGLGTGWTKAEALARGAGQEHPG